MYTGSHLVSAWPSMKNDGGDQHPLFRKLVWNELLQSRTALLAQFRDSDPRRDIDTECGYPRQISLAQMLFMYERESIATRVVNIFPDECWDMDPSVYQIEESENTPFERRWLEIEEKLKVFHYLHRIDRISGIGRYGCLLIGLDDGEPLDKPVVGVRDDGTRDPEIDRRVRFNPTFLRCYGENLAQISEIEEDNRSPRFGQPTKYILKTQAVMPEAEEASATNVSYSSEDVHWTRVLHVADNRMESEFLGVPRLQNVYNRIYDMRKLLSGSAEMFWKGAFPGYSFEVPPDLVNDVDLDTESLRAEFEKYSLNLQRFLAIKGVTVKSLSPQVADPASHIQVQINTIAMAIGCPGRILMGAEEGRLASNQDTRNWNKKTHRRNLKYTDPWVLRPFVQRLMAYRALPYLKRLKTHWPDPNTPTMEDRADVAIKMTNALSTFVSTGIASVFPFKEFLVMVMGFSIEEAIAIEKMQAPIPPENLKVLMMGTASGGDPTAVPPKDRPKSGIDKGGGK